MSTTAADPYDMLAGAMRALAEQEGAGLWKDRRRLVALLLDHQPELRREIRAIGTAVDEGVADALGRCQRQLAGIAIDRQIQLVESEAGLRPDVARGVTRAIAHALDLGPLPGVYPRAAGEGDGAPPAFAPPPTHGTVPSWQAAAAAPGLPKARLAAMAAVVLAVGVVAFGPGLRGGDPRPQGRQDNPAGANIADELTDWGVPAQATLQANVGSATPLSIPAGKRVTTGELRAMIAADPATTLIDVLANAHPETVQGARYLPNAGAPGSFADAAQAALKTDLGGITAGDPARPLVFFCYGADCWESYNATLRAAQLGYTRLYWYRGGLKSWQQSGLPMQALPAPAAR